MLVPTLDFGSLLIFWFRHQFSWVSCWVSFICACMHYNTIKTNKSICVSYIKSIVMFFIFWPLLRILKKKCAVVEWCFCLRQVISTDLTNNAFWCKLRRKMACCFWLFPVSFLFLLPTNHMQHCFNCSIKIANPIN